MDYAVPLTRFFLEPAKKNVLKRTMEAPTALLPSQAVGLGAPQTINRCHCGHYKALSRCRLVGNCVLAKFTFRRPTTTLARLTQSHAISQSIAFSSPSDQCKVRTSFTFFVFLNSFFTYNYCFLYHGDQKISWWRSCRWWGGQLRNPPAKFRCVNSDLGECFFWGLC